jgi:DNA (cytosine-5)-methyltransferase 1
MTGVSLFSSGGIGDLALRACSVEVLVASELLLDRAEVFRANYPDTEMICGDIRQTKFSLIDRATQLLGERDLDILFATPPCQGMSKNGRGKLLNGIRSGLKPSLDPRNSLALEAVEVAKRLDPKVIVFENVPEMENTLVEKPDGTIGDLLETIAELLSPRYVGHWKVIEFANYGVPQRRQRLISVFARSEPLKSSIELRKDIWPTPSHSAGGGLFTKPWVTVDAALASVPSLDASSKGRAADPLISYHRVPVLDAEKYFWVSNTPPGCSAFDNQCVNPSCMYQGNPRHGALHNDEGINRASTHTPIRCAKCGEHLPRPWVSENGTRRIMSGFTSAYKRMRGDLPSSTLTRNLSYACSDQKLHPREHRVLSLHEAFILHSISSYDFRWVRSDGKAVSDKTIREIIGESVPPLGLEAIIKHILSFSQAQDIAV